MSEASLLDEVRATVAHVRERGATGLATTAGVMTPYLEGYEAGRAVGSQSGARRQRQHDQLILEAALAGLERWLRELEVDVEVGGADAKDRRTKREIRGAAVQGLAFMRRQVQDLAEALPEDLYVEA